MQKLKIETLSSLADVPVRTVRFYIQKGLLDRPEGERRGAYYTQKHLDQLLSIKRWLSAGLSLERIGELLRGNEENLPPPRRRPGDVRVSSHLFVREGLEIVLDPTLAELSPEEVRVFARGVMALYDQVKNPKEQSTKDTER